MARPPTIDDLRAALQQRDFPTVMTWNRLEGRPRTTEFDRALRAEIRDPLWMLARQWQLGEFRGEDGGSPVTATYHVSTSRPTRYRAQESLPADLPDGQPLEAVVQARGVPFTIGGDLVSLDLRMAIGRRWAKLLNGLPGPLRKALLDRWPITVPDPQSDADAPLVAHPGVWATLQAVAGRVADGYELYQHLKSGGHPYDGVPGVGRRDRARLDELAAELVTWFEDLLVQPSGAEAFDPSRLEHRFAVAASDGVDETVLVAAEHHGGDLDWHAFSFDRSGTSLGAGAAPAATALTRTVVPGGVSFSGMPDRRWWAFEDGRTDFGAVSADTTDLVRLIFLEFALVYSDDWFLLPCDLDHGTLARVDGLVFTDVFGGRHWVEPAGTGIDDDWQRWSMFTLDVAGTTPTTAAPDLFLPPAAAGAVTGEPAERVLLVRDEDANMVWGVEDAVLLADGTSVPGAEAARETLTLRRRLHPPADALPPVAAIAYEAMNTVPENWIPFIPVHVPGDSRQIQLQRGAMPRILGDGVTPPPKVRPRTTLLRPGLDSGEPYFVHEEEVPRVGTLVTVAYRRARRHDGRAVVWLAATRATGRGEAGSGLDWDRLRATPPTLGAHAG